MWKKVAIGFLIGVSVFSVSDFIVNRRAMADAGALRDRANERQDAELQALRRDVDRIEKLVMVTNEKLSDVLTVQAETLAGVKLLMEKQK